jgi:hypothetical protein
VFLSLRAYKLPGDGMGAWRPIPVMISPGRPTSATAEADPSAAAHAG